MVVQLQNESISKMIYRLKTRLALANFKRQYGYERYDLYTLESSLLKSKKKPIKKTRHRYYPTHNHHGHKSTVPTSFQHQQQHHHHRSSLYPRYPLSEKRSTSPQQHHTSIIPTDEDAANVLVMLHNMS